MKKDIHPEYVDTKVTCACGNSFEVRSSKPELSIDICNECHPFFTGSEKIVDAAGRVDKFKKKSTNSTDPVSVRVDRRARCSPVGLFA